MSLEFIMVLSGRLGLLWAHSSGGCWLLAGCVPGGALQASLDHGKAVNSTECILRYVRRLFAVE